MIVVHATPRERGGNELLALCMLPEDSQCALSPQGHAKELLRR